MHNNCFLEGCYIIVKHLVQFFETIQSKTEGSEPQKPGVAALLEVRLLPERKTQRRIDSFRFFIPPPTTDTDNETAGINKY